MKELKLMCLTMLDQVKSWVVYDYVSTLPRRLPVAARGSKKHKEFRRYHFLLSISGPLIEIFKKQYTSHPDYNHIFKAMLTYNQIVTTGHAFSCPSTKFIRLLPDASFSRWVFQYYPRPSISLDENAPGTTVVDLRVISGTPNQLIPCLSMWALPTSVITHPICAR